MSKILLVMGVLVSFSMGRQDCLQFAEKDAMGRFTRPIKHTFVVSPSGHFYIHFDTTGSAAPNLADTDLNSIPDYVDEVGFIADSAYKVLVDEMGFSEEPHDGDGGYDIYIMSYAAGVYGYNMHESNGISYLKIDNDYLNYNSIFDLTPIEIMRITVGHEYFHGIQWGYETNLVQNQYFYEMTSMWFEDVLIPDGNDYLDGWQDEFLENPTAAFDDTGPGYELALFGHYLSSFIDPKGKEDAKNSTIMREIWERFRDYNTTVVGAAFYILENNYQWDFSEAWTDFVARNTYNSLFDTMDNPYYYYIDQALVKPIDTQPVLINSSFEFDKNISEKAAAIQSLRMDDPVLLEISHSTDDYYLRLAQVSPSGNHSFHDTLQPYLGLYENDYLHFIIGKKNSKNLVQFNLNYYPTDSLPPLPPSNLKIEASYHTFSLTWKASPGPGDSLIYHIYQVDDIDTLKVGTTDTTLINVESDYVPYQNYYFFVKCANEIGESLPTETVEVYYPIHQPAQPENIFATPMQDSISVIWNTSKGPGDSLYYQLFRNEELIQTTADTTWLDINIIGSNYYQYSVIAMNDEGASGKVEAVQVLSWPEVISVTENTLISVYPNPYDWSSDLHIIYSLNGDGIPPELSLVDVRGRKILSQKLAYDKKGWHRQNIAPFLSGSLSTGIYFITLSPSNKKAGSIKLTLRK
jgi:hypothetical protein